MEGLAKKLIVNMDVVMILTAHVVLRARKLMLCTSYLPVVAFERRVTF